MYTFIFSLKIIFSGVPQIHTWLKRVVAVGNAEKHHIMTNVSPNCTGTFPERIGRKTMFNEMTQKQREETNAPF